MKGDKGRQMNPSTQRPREPCQASGRQRERNEGRQEPCQASRLGENGRHMKGDKGRQMNASTQRAMPGIQAGRQREANEGRQRETNERRPPREPCQASRLGDNGRQMKGDKGRQMNRPPKEPCQASRLWLGNRRVTLNEFRTPHSKLFGEKNWSFGRSSASPCLFRMTPRHKRQLVLEALAKKPPIRLSNGRKQISLRAAIPLKWLTRVSVGCWTLRKRARSHGVEPLKYSLQASDWWGGAPATSTARKSNAQQSPLATRPSHSTTPLTKITR